MDDQSLAETNPSPAEPPTGAPDGALPSSHQLTVDEILDSARRLEKVAWICTRADLQAEHDQLLSELALLVDEHGELLDDPESSVGDSTHATRAADVNGQLLVVRRQMTESMWSVRFRAMPSDDWAVFIEANMPTKAGTDLRPFFNLLMAECAIEPTLTVEQAEKMRKVFDARQVKTLADTAWAVNTEGGLDVPKLPAYLPDLMLGQSAA